MAFRRSWLEVINGFDPQFRQAGDDVDICWRTRERGGKLGFSPAAMVWHHYRRTVRAYWKQQMGYGKAEAMLERKWPEKFAWRPLLSALPAALAAFVLSLVVAISAALKLRPSATAKTRFARFRVRVLIVALRLLQPLARLWSRLVYSLTAWRIRRFPTLSFPWPRMFQLWSEKWLDSAEILISLQSVLARAFLKDAPILILDEPTSSVDVRTEALILDALRRLAHGGTTLVITHRPSALKQCDVIVRIDRGTACGHRAKHWAGGIQL